MKLKIILPWTNICLSGFVIKHIISQHKSFKSKIDFNDCIKRSRKHLVLEIKIIPCEWYYSTI
jgi:hypothetical protein